MWGGLSGSERGSAEARRKLGNCFSKCGPAPASSESLLEIQIPSLFHSKYGFIGF